MIKVDDDQTTIRLTRGDGTHTDYNKLAFYYPIWDYENDEETKYEFQPTDIITLIVYEKKGYTKREILYKTYTLSSLGYINPTTDPELVLTYEDTRTFELTKKPKTYNYELILNTDTTMIGSDENGDKKFIVYPGGTLEERDE